jgi:hypothetical protein
MPLLPASIVLRGVVLLYTRKAPGQKYQSKEDLSIVLFV